ncbi:unnamed protein product, partial [Prorocentrum cordatum]
ARPARDLGGAGRWRPRAGGGRPAVAAREHAPRDPRFDAGREPRPRRPRDRRPGRARRWPARGGAGRRRAARGERLGARRRAGERPARGELDQREDVQARGRQRGDGGPVARPPGRLPARLHLRGQCRLRGDRRERPEAKAGEVLVDRGRRKAAQHRGQGAEVRDRKRRHAAEGCRHVRRAQGPERPVIHAARGAAAFAREAQDPVQEHPLHHRPADGPRRWVRGAGGLAPRAHGRGEARERAGGRGHGRQVRSVAAAGADRAGARRPPGAAVQEVLRPAADARAAARGGRALAADDVRQGRLHPEAAGRGGPRAPVQHGRQGRAGAGSGAPAAGRRGAPAAEEGGVPHGADQGPRRHARGGARAPSDREVDAWRGEVRAAHAGERGVLAGLGPEPHRPDHPPRPPAGPARRAAAHRRCFGLARGGGLQPRALAAGGHCAAGRLGEPPEFPPRLPLSQPPPAKRARQGL